MSISDKGLRRVAKSLNSQQTMEGLSSRLYTAIEPIWEDLPSWLDAEVREGLDSAYMEFLAKVKSLSETHLSSF